SQATGGPAMARNRSGYLTARVIGKTSPKVVRTNTSTMISTKRPTVGPKMLSAIVAASAAAPMLITVMPTSKVTSSSCGRSMSVLGSPTGSSWSLGATCLSRARPSEKYAASAPVRIAEQRISMHSAKNFRPKPSGTGAPRHEVLEPRTDRHGAPIGVEILDALGVPRHPAHRGERGPDRAREPVGQAIERVG